MPKAKRQQSKRRRTSQKLIERGGFLAGHKEKAVKVPKRGLIEPGKGVRLGFV